MKTKTGLVVKAIEVLRDMDVRDVESAGLQMYRNEDNTETFPISVTFKPDTQHPRTGKRATASPTVTLDEEAAVIIAQRIKEAATRQTRRHGQCCDH